VLSPTVDLATMSDPRDDDKAVVVVDGVDDAVVAHTDAVVAASGELRGAWRPWIFREGVDRVAGPVPDTAVEVPERPSRLGVQANVVLAGYSRTSAHGTARSRSSPAVSAARLSSRYSSRSTSSA
jgi:hypothetical protein